jgi:hypothetical protein
LAGTFFRWPEPLKGRLQLLAFGSLPFRLYEFSRYSFNNDALGGGFHQLMTSVYTLSLMNPCRILVVVKKKLKAAQIAQPWGRKAPRKSRKSSFIHGLHDFRTSVDTEKRTPVQEFR